MRGLHLGTSRVKSQMMPTCPNPVPRTSSQFLQEFSSYFGLIPHTLLHLQRSQVPASIGGSLVECLTNKFQAYRLRVTHLKMNKRIGFKDESKQRRECKAEFPALTVAAAALPRQTKLHRKEGLLTLNPVSNRQFLTLLYIVKRLSDIAEVLNKHAITIHCSYVSGQIEHYRAMF